MSSFRKYRIRKNVARWFLMREPHIPSDNEQYINYYETFEEVTKAVGRLIDMENQVRKALHRHNINKLIKRQYHDLVDVSNVYH